MDFRVGRTMLLALAVAVALIPVFASADTLSDLQTQVQNLIAQITELQGSLSATSSATQTLPQISSEASSALASSVCPVINESLAPGSSGSDVANLQAFLAEQGLFHASVTAYFGAITEAAVQNWQTAHGIVSSGTPDSTGFGVLGPRTAAAIAALCGQASVPTSSSQSASCLPALPPTAECSTGWQSVTDGSGCTSSYQCSVPLPSAVSMTGSCNAGYAYENGACVPNVTSCPAIAISCPAGTQADTGANCSQQCVSNTAVTVKAQCPTYSIPACPNGTLVSEGTAANGCELPSVCMQAVCPLPMVECAAGYHQVQSTGVNTNGCQLAPSCVPNVSATLSVSPSSGSAPLAVTFSGTVNGSNSYSLDFGDGSTPVMQIENYECAQGATCAPPAMSINTSHTYSSVGTYAATLTSGGTTVGTATVTVTSGSACPVAGYGIECVQGYKVQDNYNSNGCEIQPTCVPN